MQPDWLDSAGQMSMAHDSESIIIAGCNRDLHWGPGDRILGLAYAWQPHWQEVCRVLAELSESSLTSKR